MGSFIDITGQKFNRLTVIERVGKTNRSATWKCSCDCGNVVVVRGNYLRSGHTKSCGCHRREKAQANGKSNKKHGLCSHPLYKVWRDIIARCEWEKADSYNSYGGRGIKVCEEWRNDFKCFYDDNIAQYSKGLQIDRIDNEKDYSPDNCRWVTPKQNTRNKRDTIYYKGVPAIEVCEKVGINYKTFASRFITKGWPIEKALFTPVDLSKSHTRLKKMERMNAGTAGEI